MSPSRSIELSSVIARLQDELSRGGVPVTARVVSAWTRPFSEGARIELHSAGGTRRVIAKIPRCRPGKVDRRLPQLEREWASAGSLAAIFAGEDALGVAQVVAFYRDVPALVWAEVEGTTLASLVEHLGRGMPGAGRLRRLEAACRNAGRWLRVLQEATPVERQQLSLQEMTDYVDIRLRRISELRPRRFGERWRAEIRRLFADATLAPGDLRVAGIHGDYTLSNIMCGADRLVAIDVGRFGTGSVS
jgi:hypothetical protein